MSNLKLGGVIAAVPTPVDAKGVPNIPALLTFCERLLSTGCHAINLLGTTGEATSFSTEKRMQVMEEVASTKLSQRMMVGTGANSLAEAVLLTRHAQECGFKGALLLPPFYYPDATEDGLFDFFSQLAQAVDPRACGLYLYNIPQNTGIKFTQALVARLIEEHPTVFIGLKDSSGDLDYAASVARQFPGFDVFPSNEATLAITNAQGFAGCISASVNVAPWLAREVYEHQSTSVPAYEAMNAVRQRLALRGLVPAVKAAVSILQADEGWSRLMQPLRALTGEQVDAVRSDLQAAGVFNA